MTMPLLVSQVVNVTKRRAGQFAVIADVNDEEMHDAMGWATRTLGNETADILAVTDADLSVLETGEYDAMLGLTELRTLETILQNYLQVDRSVRDTDEAFDQLRKMLEKRIPELRKNLQAQYGHILAYPLTAAGADRLWDELERDSLPKARIRNAGAFQ